MLEGLSRLHWILAVIVQGRLDMVCPPATAPALARAWPGADLRMVEQGGHSAFGNGLAEALVKGLLRLQGARLVQGIYSK